MSDSNGTLDLIVKTDKAVRNDDLQGVLWPKGSGLQERALVSLTGQRISLEAL